MNMTFNRIVNSRQISAEQLSKGSGVPRELLNNLIDRKISLDQCSAETVSKIAKALDTTADELLETFYRYRPAFGIFKSNVCHRLKRLGDFDFLIDVLENDEIMEYFNLDWHPECLYMLAMVDYISRINDIPLCCEYDFLRLQKLESVVYPTDILLLNLVFHNDDAKKEAWENAIPEFKRFNIVENEIRDVI